jgi:hypothetical protein
MFHFAYFHVDVRGELRFSLYGGTAQDYLDTLPEEISDGGTSFAGGAHIKLACPFRIQPRAVVAPFLGGGLTFGHLQANGEGIDPTYNDDLSYKVGWTEFAIYSPLNAGFNLDFITFSISPEFRYILYGQAATDLPRIPSVRPDRMKFWGVMLTLGFRIR